MKKQEKIIEKLKNKNVAILGFGREGISTYKYIRKYLPEKFLTIIDEKDIKDNEFIKGDNNLSFVIGSEYLNNLDIYDLIIKTPGISLKEVEVKSFKHKITSQIELLLEEYKDNVIGITGTKGKSTMCTLLYEIFKNSGKDVFLLGNIGVPVFDEIDNFKDDSILVVEMSSFQIEYLKTAPHIAIILNLFIDHLNHAGSIENYHESKLNIFKVQDKNDIGIFICDVEPLNTKVRNNKYKHKEFKISYEKQVDCDLYMEDGFIIYKGEKIFNTNIEMNLKGKHIFENLMTILLVCELYKIDRNIILKTVKEFKTLPHRMEFVVEKDGIKYYNDSIATVPEATMCSIDTIKDVDTLITGGSDKGSDYKEFIDFLSKSSIKNIIFMPDTGYILKEELEKICKDKNLYLIEKLKDAVDKAKEITDKGKSCLMSPAAANFTEYANYVAKGEAFKEFVKGSD